LSGGGSRRARVKSPLTPQLSPCVDSLGFETDVVSCAAISASFAWRVRRRTLFRCRGGKAGLAECRLAGNAEAMPIHEVGAFTSALRIVQRHVASASDASPGRKVSPLSSTRSGGECLLDRCHLRCCFPHTQYEMQPTVDTACLAPSSDVCSITFGNGTALKITNEKAGRVRFPGYLMDCLCNSSLLKMGTKGPPATVYAAIQLLSPT
jgi:hypothetical protein